MTVLLDDLGPGGRDDGRQFILPPDREATSPPEARGLARDAVRLLVSDPSSNAGDTLTHAVFRELPHFLRPGDLLVVNDSATLPAALDTHGPDGTPVVVHFATWLDDGSWVVEVRTRVGAPSDWSQLHTGDGFALPGGITLRLGSPWLPPARRLWTAHVDVEAPVTEYLRRHGRPISYAYLHGRWSLEYYRTVFGRRPGSAEMPSAARPFTDSLVTDLVVAGVGIAPITLHTGVSSPETGEPPSPERYAVSCETARRVNETRASGGRVVAVGTTVTRALESRAMSDGRVLGGGGWTNLVLSARRETRAVDGLITGWHAPGASHLDLLEAVVGSDAVRRAYATAIDTGYLWHEFGDSALLLR
ncbi:MAG TPA: S-adenosylmethionine:tRNA ribosyltransferase-isomerase [Aldersonia sp.]